MKGAGVPFSLILWIGVQFHSSDSIIPRFDLSGLFRIDSSGPSNFFLGLFCEQPEKMASNTVERLGSLGYPVEVHTVTTKDGYILEIHRIPHGKREGAATPRSPIVLLPGAVASSEIYLVNAANQSLGFVLADSGYDVWLVNYRGNSYSRRHVKLDPGKTKFWRFSMDEFAKYDVPAVIDYVLDVTSEPQLQLVGYSLGVTVALAMFSTEVQYNDKVKNLFALAPTTYLNNLKSILGAVSLFMFNVLYGLLDFAGIHEVMARDWNVMQLSAKICGCGIMREVCAGLIGLAIGRNPKETNETRLPVYLHSFPDGSSLDALHHLSQNWWLKQFLHYDWGQATNLIKYGQSVPPAYNLSYVNVPVHLIYGLGDLMVPPRDVLDIALSLPSVADMYPMSDPQWGHIDFMWGIHAGPLVTDIINSVN